MPGRNGMGPIGQGPMTGGERGWCGGSSARGEGVPRGPGFGRGRGNGRGGGFRHRHGFCATGQLGWQREATGWTPRGTAPAPCTEQELALLRQQVNRLEQMHSDLKSQLQALRGSVAESKD